MLQLIALAATVILHAALVGFALWDDDDVTTTHQPPQETSIHVRLLSTDEADGIEDSQTKENGTISAAADVGCKSENEKYYGIGILHVQMMVIQAPPEYPAYQAGIRVGDLITNLYHENGIDYLNVEVTRDNTALVFLRIKKVQVCFDKIEPKT